MHDNNVECFSLTITLTVAFYQSFLSDRFMAKTSNLGGLLNFRKLTDSKGQARYPAKQASQPASQRALFAVRARRRAEH